MMGLGNLDQAKADLLQAARREPKNAEIRTQIQTCQRKAKEDYKDGIRAFGGMFERNLGTIYKEMKDASPNPVRSLTELPRVFLNFRFEKGVAEEEAENHMALPDNGLVNIVLYSDTAPRAVQNFTSLCKGTGNESSSSDKPLSYRGSHVHRLEPSVALYGGDVENNDGTGGESIFGGYFDDEDLKGIHDRRGLLSMANSGPNTNGSQFILTLASAPHLDGKNVLFGEVVSGFAVLDALAASTVDEKGRPSRRLTIVDCGEPLGNQVEDMLKKKSRGEQ